MTTTNQLWKIFISEFVLISSRITIYVTSHGIIFAAIKARNRGGHNIDKKRSERKSFMKEIKKRFTAGLAVMALTASLSAGCSRIDTMSDVSDASSSSLNKKAGVSYSAKEITGTAANEDSLESTAKELYKKAVEMYFGMLFNGSYYKTGSEEIQPQFMNVTDIRVTCIDDIKTELRTVFSESLAAQYDSMIDSNYKEANGKVYQLNKGKGGNVSLKGWDIEKVSADDKEAVFNVTAHYIYGNVIHPLRMVYENDSWKISEYSDPNTEPAPTSEVTKTVENGTPESAATNVSTEYLNSFAKDMYMNARNLYFGIIVNGSYFEENGDTIQDEYGITLHQISDSRVSGIEDIKNLVCEVFTETLTAEYESSIDLIYMESDGLLYQKHMGKGDVFSAEDIELEAISANENYAVFNVKKYQPNTQRTGNYTEERFAITKESGSWKICEFSYY